MLKCPQETVQFFLKKISRMKKNSEVVGFYEFGDFRLDCASRTLWRGSELISLPPKVFDTLCVLVEKQGKIVSKQEIIDLVWADSFVEEGNLTQNIYMLRRILGANENGKSFIETISRKGYRFTTEVKVIGNDSAAVIAEFSTQSDVLPINKKSHLFKYLIPIVVSVSIIFSLIFLGLYYSRLSNKETKTAPTPKVDFRQLTFTRDISSPVIAPAGDIFAYVRNGEIFIQEIDSEKVTKIDIPNERVITALQFSPDGKMISYRNQKAILLPGEVFQVSRFGGQPQKIAEDVWSGFSFSPNGNLIAFIRRLPNSTKQALIVKNLNSGEEREVTILDVPMRFIQVGYPSWSPDGSKIAIAISKQIIQVSSSFLAVFDVKSGAMEEFNIPKLKQVGQTVWFPEGNSLAIIAREDKKFLQLWEIAYPDGKFRHITNDAGTYRTLSLSSDGKKILTGQFSTFSHIWTLNNDDPATAKQITFGNQNRDGIVGLCTMPNGEIVYSSRISGNLDLWKVNPQSGTKQQLTTNAGDANSQPTPSPDGKFIYFTSNRTGTNQVWRMDSANGENPTQITFGEKEVALLPQISPDGNTLYYLKKTDKKTSIWQKSLVDGKDGILLVEGELSPTNSLSLSPDGKFLATCNTSENNSDESTERNFQIAIVSTSIISKPSFFPSTTCDIVWSFDGKAFDYVENLEEGSKIWRQKVETDSKPQLVLDLKDGKIANFSRSTDGKNMAFSNGKESMDAMQLVDFR